VGRLKPKRIGPLSLMGRGGRNPRGKSPHSRGPGWGDFSWGMARAFHGAHPRDGDIGFGFPCGVTTLRKKLGVHFVPSQGISARAKLNGGGGG